MEGTKPSHRKKKNYKKKKVLLILILQSKVSISMCENEIISNLIKILIFKPCQHR